MKNQIDEQLSLAHKYWRQGNEKKMLIPLKKALDAAKAEHNIAKAVEILNEYGGALRVTGDYAESAAVLNEALELISQHYSPHSEAYATTLMNLANALRVQGSLVESEKRFIQAKELYEALNLYDYPYASLCNNLSLAYQSSGKYAEARQLLLDAEALLKDNPKLAVPMAISYNNLFDVCKNLGFSKEAIAYLLKAEKLLNKSVGRKHPLYAAILNNMASVFYEQGELERSLMLYEISLELVAETYGTDSSDYQSVAANVAKLKETLQQQRIQTGSGQDKQLEDRRITGHGMSLAKSFFHSELLPLFKEAFPDLFEECAFGLVGQGSECYGFDDELSRDHDFEKRCMLWLPKESYEKNHTRLRQWSEKLSGRLDVHSIEHFYKNFTLKEGAPETLQEWQQIPQDFLSTATNGQVFLDNYGHFTIIRNQLLRYYPEDLRLKKMAYCCNKIAQAGQYNYSRCLNRGNFIGAQAALSEFIRSYTECIHLLNKRYLPFYKWYEKSLTACELFGKQTAADFNQLLKDTSHSNEALIEQMCQRLTDHFNKTGLSHSSVTFLTYQAEEIIQNISDNTLKNQNTWVL